MKINSVYDCSVIELPRIHNRAGNITPVENLKSIPFEIKRVYYLYDVPGGESRGGHAHKKLQQLLIAASGAFDITLDDGVNKRTITLNRPNYGLHIVPGIWRELSNFSSGAICLALASENYDEKDYIRNYKDFIHFKQHKAPRYFEWVMTLCYTYLESSFRHQHNVFLKGVRHG